MCAVAQCSRQNARVRQRGSGAADQATHLPRCAPRAPLLLLRRCGCPTLGARALGAASSFIKNNAHAPLLCAAPFLNRTQIRGSTCVSPEFFESFSVCVFFLFVFLSQNNKRRRVLFSPPAAGCFNEAHSFLDFPTQFKFLFTKNRGSVRLKKPCVFGFCSSFFILPLCSTQATLCAMV